MNMLGNTIEEIAFEKAGIIKENIPVVIGERKPGSQEVFEATASQKNAPLFFADDRFAVTGYQLDPEAITIGVTDKSTGANTVYETDLPGIYQTKNLLTLLQALALLKGWKIEADQIHSALKKVRPLTGLYGRWEVIHKHPSVVLEVAHNKDGLEQMLHHLQQLDFERLHIIIGMVKDKDVNAVLQLLPPDANYYFSRATIPRALDPAELQEMAASFSLKGTVYEDVNKAIAEALRQAGKNDLIIVCGSIFLIAEVNKALVGKPA
jgi:dihydrofolate synthase/folylpolyglutamate synthase